MPFKRSKLSSIGEYIRKRLLLFVCVIIFIIIMGMTVTLRPSKEITPVKPTAVVQQSAPIVVTEVPKRVNPLKNKKFYVDSLRPINTLSEKYRAENNITNAVLAEKIANQPGTTWLVGPTESDTVAHKDVELVLRTSQAAVETNTVVIYELYAIPNRDACGGYSINGFKTNQEYLNWIDRIITALKGDAVFSVEADAIPHAAKNSCLNQKQIDERYELLRAVTKKLHHAPHVVGVYIDAGHSEWYTDPYDLVEPLKRAGVSDADGIAVNVSFYVETKVITAWSQKLVQALGGKHGVIIDTSRNGNGVPPLNVKGEARWCNSKGRALGLTPTTNLASENIDAYFWGKVVGDSDGSCFGNQPAGTFDPTIALEIAQNSK